MTAPVSPPSPRSPNFAFLADEPLLAELAARAERYVFEDPNAALVKLRQMGEVIAQQAAAYTGRYAGPDIQQLDLLRRLENANVIEREVAALFHALRMSGNRATHQHIGDQREALHQLRAVWRLAIWFQRSFKDPAFRASPFVPPPPPRAPEPGLELELAQLRQALARSEAGRTDAEARAAEAAAVARAANDELAVALDLAAETEAGAHALAATAAALEDQLAALQAQAIAAPAAVATVIQQAQTAGAHVDLDELETRALIDAQLRDAGWEADSTLLRWTSGTRPAKGRDLAIAEVPTAHGPADYVLYSGLTPLAVVEAKRQAKHVAGSIEQAKRYSRGYTHQAGELVPAGAPWGDYRVPFLFATNGRPFLRQLLEHSGIWFLDARRATNHPRALHHWYTPEGLGGLLARDSATADQSLAHEPTDYLHLYDYQIAAIKAVEAAIARGQQHILLAMATGTGKTRTALGLIYRLVKSGRFRRVLFMVDRTSLGVQTRDVFTEVQLENLQSFSAIYDMRELADLSPEPETRLHLATIQGMVKRVLDPGDEPPPPIDAYDCIIIDECHRGYTLDRELSDAELGFRSEAEYISKYRRVLDHFDATRIGLTATPALHTTEIFGAPVFQYGYRQAVIEGRLVDHRPPIRIKTALGEGGIHWGVGEEVAVYDRGSGQLDLFATPDEIDIDIDGFNTQVVTEAFNRVVCRQLAREIDPSLPGKTLVFCATDAHADMVVRLLKAAFADSYGEVPDDAVQKITGAADKPLDKIKRFKNERLPNVAVTVDLLTTGIDVPEIVNVVFLRRVRSRILYEQMLGRATRLPGPKSPPDLVKEYFRIFDAVDLYSDMQDWTDMVPVVTRPDITFDQLARELAAQPTELHRQVIVEQLRAKMQRKRRRMQPEHIDAFAIVAGRSLDDFMNALQHGALDSVAALIAAHPEVPAWLDRLSLGGDRTQLVSEDDDRFLGTETGYGDGRKPDDYLEGFKRFLAEHANDIAALLVVTQRPRDLTRKELRELTFRLDAAGYSLSALRTAHHELTNQDIAASLIGFIRQHALGSPLLPYDERIAAALKRVLAKGAWTTPQRTWLERIAKQIKVEGVVDREALDQGQFRSEGGFARLNKVFDGKLEQVLATLHDELWRDAV